jgi:hypothetical protein
VTKRRASTDQLGFSFEPRSPVSGPAALAGVEAQASAAVAGVLKGDLRTREEIAGAMSAALGEEVSRWMLDAYASPARDAHNISLGRAVALMAVTGDRGMIEWVVGLLGGTVLWGEEIMVARLGQLEARKRQIEGEIRDIKGRAIPIKREGRR